MHEQEQTYTVRDSTVKLVEQTGTLAVKLSERRTLEEQSPAEIVEDMNLGALATEQLKARSTDPFVEAGWLLVHPSESVRSAVEMARPPEGTSFVGRVYRDESGTTFIDTHHLMVKVDPILDSAQAERLLTDRDFEIVRTMGFAPNLFEVSVPDGQKTLDAVDSLSGLDEVVYAEPSLIEHVQQRSSGMQRTDYRPNDPRYDQQWQWRVTDIERAWSDVTGAGVRIAIVDNGFDIEHEDLTDAVDDATGYYDSGGVSSGRFKHTTNGYPINDHGTFCAGMAGADGDNSVGGCGAAWDADLSLVACLDDQVGTQTTLALALAYAANPGLETEAEQSGLGHEDGADVIACSLGPSSGANWTMHSVLKDAIDYAVQNGRGGKGTPVFWAASNGNVTIDGEDGTDQVVAYENTVAVGRSTDSDDQHFSAYGPSLDLLAPGVDVVSTGSNDTYRADTGTSFAAPLVAGVAGLVLEADPSLDWEDVVWTILDTCDQIGGVTYEGGHNHRYGFGRINAGEAVSEALKGGSEEPSVDDTTTVPSITIPDSVVVDAGPPTFSVNSGENDYFTVELATRAELFHRSAHGNERTRENFYPLYGTEAAPRHTGQTYSPPAAVWDRLLAANPERIYVRLHTTASETGWDNWKTTHEDQDFASVPAIEIKSTSENGSTPTNGNASRPTIDGPDAVDPDGEPPTFNVNSRENDYFAVELATRAELFHRSAHGNERTRANFYPLYGTEAAPRHTGQTYSPPAAVWDRLIESAPDRVFYRLQTAANETGWDNWQVSHPDDEWNTVPSLRVIGGQLIQGSVGVGGQNAPADVRAVKQRLVDLGYDWLTVNSSIDDDFVATINLFQSITNGRDTVRGDGRVDLNGSMHTWLDAANAPRWQRMPEGSRDGTEGFYNYEVVEQTNDDHDYGTDWLATVITNAGATYQADYRSHEDAAPITVNDASRPQGGDTPDHSGHETGLAADLRLPRTDGTAPGNTTHWTDTYDQDTMRAMLTALHDQPLVDRVFFNDPDLVNEGLCSDLSGHDNHAHVEIEPPAQTSRGERSIEEPESITSGRRQMIH